MCLIIHKPNKDLIIPDHILDNAELINPDGFGIVYTDTNECVRTMDYNHARELVLAERPCVAHYRFATRGPIDRQSCHPYHVKNYARLFSNGTIADLGDDNTCDAYVVAKYLRRAPAKIWDNMLSMTDTRFAITYPDGLVRRHGTWHERDGVFYSKNNCFHTHTSSNGYHYGRSTYEYDPGIDDYGMSCTSMVNKNSYDPDPDPDKDPWEEAEEQADNHDWQSIYLLAVYGTLKAGRANHHLLEESAYVGAGVTVSKYGMQTPTGKPTGVPCVYKDQHKHQIGVEVYYIRDRRIRENIDQLEGHPIGYERELTEIELLDGSVKTCWLYFANPAWRDEKMTRYIQAY